jgi:O-acetyl-ADP-ribose deacetylase (regulator of RNase III)
VPKENPKSMHKDWQPLGFVSSWGGMEVGNGMLYSVSVVDGLVHQLGGWKLEAECTWKRMSSSSGEACPIGSAVQTTAGDDRLKKEYSAIIHTTPPFFQHDSDPEQKLQNCYESALSLAFQDNNGGPLRVATPLLGSGARGFPHEQAMEVASSACVKWCNNGTSDDTVVGDKKAEQAIVFGLLEKDLAETFSEMIDLKSGD